MPDTLEIHSLIVWLIFGMAAVTFVMVVFITAPYGRHMSDGWGPSISARTGWLLMETPPVLVFFGFYSMGQFRAETIPLIFLFLWQTHYIYRAYVFPFKTRHSGKHMPVLVLLLALIFNSLNAYINARWISHFGQYSVEWLTDPRFIIGVVVFFSGMFINRQSDNILINLRKPGESGYKIPEGGLYRFVSCPNYLGELLEWLGWAIATWSLAGLAFAIYTAANLAPRAVTNHKWYQAKFPDYPESRRALIPFVI